MSNKLCSFCCEKEVIEEFSKVGQYNSPWDKVPASNGYCGEECLQNSEDSYYSDYAYQYCEGCSKNIIIRCPSNGWHEYFRYSKEHGQECLKCYQERLFKNGISEESLEKGTLEGSFFDDSDLEKEGFKKYDDYFVKGTTGAKSICLKALALINKGKKILVNYERLSILGDEGSISLWIK
jgi:hypothetical protein